MKGTKGKGYIQRYKGTRVQEHKGTKVQGYNGRSTPPSKPVLTLQKEHAPRADVKNPKRSDSVVAKSSLFDIP